jgi:hypothetical protein
VTPLAVLVQLLKRKGHIMGTRALTDHDNVPVMDDVTMARKEPVRAVLGRLEDADKRGATPSRCEPYGTRTRRSWGLGDLFLK